MKIDGINFARMATVLGVIFLTGCDEPVKKPDAALDRAVEKTADAFVSAAEKAEAAAKKAAEAAEKFADKAVEKTGEALEKAGAAIEKTGEEMQD
jgi:hypothetical protein